MKGNRAVRATPSSSDPRRKPLRRNELSIRNHRQQQEQQLRATIGRAARQARMRSGLTQAEVAESIGTVTEVYGRMERGKLLPSVPTLLRLCMALHSGPHELMGFIPVGPAGGGRPWEQHEASAGQSKAPELQRLVRRLGRLERSELRLVLYLVSSLATRRSRR